MINPLLYASDLWRILKQPTNNPIENLPSKSYQDLLGVQSKHPLRGTTRLGQTPISNAVTIGLESAITANATNNGNISHNSIQNNLT